MKYEEVKNIEDIKENGINLHMPFSKGKKVSFDNTKNQMWKLDGMYFMLCEEDNIFLTRMEMFKNGKLIKGKKII